jgi:transposase
MKLYIGIDLHSSNNYVAILDEGGKKVFKKKLANDPRLITEALKPYRDNVAGIAVESTYNWYWLVDALTEEGYPVHLANPVAMKKYAGLKYTDDKHDAFWRADLLRLDIRVYLSSGYASLEGPAEKAAPSCQSPNLTDPES